MFRTIYMIEVLQDADTADDMLVARRFAANRKTADRIAKQYKGDVEVNIRKTQKCEHAYISVTDVERR